MKICLMTLFLAFAASTDFARAAEATPGQDNGDFTIQWRQMTKSAEQVEPSLRIGDVEVAVRPLPKAKPKEAPKAALFVGDRFRSKTLIHPGKWYHFVLAGRDGKVTLYVNGYPDGSEAVAMTLPGEVKASDGVEQVTRSTGAMGHRLVLNKFKENLTSDRHPIAVAHRGVHKHAPENTRISYVQAIEAGAPMVEFDTALTKDGHIVGMHDKTVDRTTDGTGAVAEMTLEQIKKLDAGAWKHEKYKGEPVPTIDDVADVVRGKAILMLDLKAEGQGEAIARWLASSRFPKDQIILAPWEDAEGVALRKHVKDVPMIRLTTPVPTKTIDDAYFAKMKSIGFSGFSVNFGNLTKAFVDAARKNGMNVYAWTINDNPEIAGAMLLGVDGIITDDPAVTAKTVGQLARK
jgi:glycerophosphoryl diester phosphodiesterase